MNHHELNDEIRNVRADEMDQHFALSSFAFQYDITPEEIELRKPWFEPEWIWGYFTGGQLAAKVVILPFETYIQGKPILMGGIAGVATWPEHRRGGKVGKLLSVALKAMKEKGQIVSFLSPFDFPFYRKYGWETYVEKKRYTIEKALLPTSIEAGGRVVRKTKQDWPLLDRIYDEYARAYNGTIKRTEHLWSNINLRAPGQIAVYYDGQEEPRGYIYYEVKNSAMTIRELVFLDESARLGLLKFIANHDSMLERVTLDAPADDPLAFLLPNPRIKQEVVPYFMARIVDFPAFVESYAFAANPSADGTTHVLRLKIADKHAPWNDGGFMLTVDADGRGSAEPLRNDGGEAATVPQLSCDIQTLTAMMLGYRRPALMSAIGRLQGDTDAVQLLESLIPHKLPYLMDFF